MFVLTGLSAMVVAMLTIGFQTIRAALATHCLRFKDGGDFHFEPGGAVL